MLEICCQSTILYGKNNFVPGLWDSLRISRVWRNVAHHCLKRTPIGIICVHRFLPLFFNRRLYGIFAKPALLSISRGFKNDHSPRLIRKSADRPLLTGQDHVVADVDQQGRPVAGRVVGRGHAEFDRHRAEQRARGAATRPVRARSAVSAEHRAEYVVGPHVADHVRDEHIAGDQAYVVSHLFWEATKNRQASP